MRNANLEKTTGEAGAQPYPHGRWTPRKSSLKPISELHTGPMQSFFWHDEESSLVQDAARRLERLLATAAGAATVQDCPAPKAA